MGVERPRCHRDANGLYHYLYSSPLFPAPNADAVPVGYTPVLQPVVVVAPAAASTPVPVFQFPPLPVTTTCVRNGAMTSCTSS